MNKSFIKMPWCIYTSEKLDCDEKLMMGLILSFKESGKKAIISNNAFSKFLNLSTSTFKRKKEHLQELGLIKLVQKKKTFNLIETITEYVIDENVFNNFFEVKYFEKKTTIERQYSDENNIKLTV